MDGPFVPSPPWLVWQLADSAFPAGGFAHSGGLEAAWQLGHVEDFDVYLDQSVRQVGRLALPFVRAAHHAPPSRLAALDALADATLTNHVTNRASRAQGRAFWATASEVFDDARMRALRGAVHGTHKHHAPVFGAVSAALGVDAEAGAAVFLHASLRGTLSAAVRLGIVGPLEAQRLQTQRAPLLDEVLGRSRRLAPEDAAETAPLFGACAALHDGLYARLFQS